MNKLLSISVVSALLATTAATAQRVNVVSSTESKVWQQSKTRLQTKAASTPALEINGNETGTTFKNWGTCFNELGWDALNLLPDAEQQKIMARLFAPDGDLRFTMGRIPINANDYARSWYSCDEVAGDFHLKYFNVERDKSTLIPYIKKAQQQNPEMAFWASPWSPPSWMKINADYPVRSDKKFNKMDPRKDYLLYEGEAGDRDDYKAPTGKTFPAKLAVTDYLIQDPRYLQAYADFFSRFITEYGKQGIDISMVMYQNEAWSYTPYPGCAWTPKGVIRFNTEYLAPTLKRDHPEVDVYLGTINTNRYNFIDEVLSDSRMPSTVKGIGLQWEGGQILPALKKKYPNYRYVQTESECGWGSFDWNAAEHTFERINHYLGNGCEEYTFWNAILADNGFSTWGWKQNALIRVDSKNRTATLTPEYYAVKHYGNAVPKGSVIVAQLPADTTKTPVLVVRTPAGKTVVLAGNFNGEARSLTLKIKNKYLNMNLPVHSLNTFTINK